MLYPLSYGRCIVRKALVYQRFWRILLSVMAQRRDGEDSNFRWRFKINDVIREARDWRSSYLQLRRYYPELLPSRS